MNAESMVFRSLICFVTVCGNMYGSTEGSTGKAKPGKPCAVRVYSRNDRSNTVSKAPAALRSSARDNGFYTASLPLTLCGRYFFCLNCGASRRSRFERPPRDNRPLQMLKTPGTRAVPGVFSLSCFVPVRCGYLFFGDKSKQSEILRKTPDAGAVVILWGIRRST